MKKMPIKAFDKELECSKFCVIYSNLTHARVLILFSTHGEQVGNVESRKKTKVN